MTINTGYAVQLSHREISKNLLTGLQAELGNDEAINLAVATVDFESGDWVVIERGLRTLMLEVINPNRAAGIAALAGLVADAGNSPCSNNSMGS